MKTRPRVVIESPFKASKEASQEEHVEYARRALFDSLTRGEAPLASHLLHTQVLCDDVMSDRVMGIEAGLSWTPSAECVAVYRDYGISQGMLQGIEHAKEHGVRVVARSIGKNPT